MTAAASQEQTSKDADRGKWARRVVAIPAVIVLFVMSVHVVANALSRTFFRAPLPDTLELTQFWYLPIVALLGMIAAQQTGQHIAAELIYERLPSKGKRFYEVVGLLLCIGLSAGFTWFGFVEALDAFERLRTAGVTTLPIWPVYFLVPITFGTLAIQYIRLLIKGKGFDVDVDGTPGDEIE